MQIQCSLVTAIKITAGNWPGQIGLDHFCAHWCKFVTIWYKLGWGLWRQAGSVQFGADLVQFGATVGKSLAVVICQAASVRMEPARYMYVGAALPPLTKSDRRC